jgi:HD-GYP domain-containing protein (c-di-GMP phosphodiesterase class II)
MSKTPDENIVLDLLLRQKILNKIGIALSAEKDGTRLLEMILTEAKRLACADGGTLYTRTADNQLKFEIMLTNTLNIHTGGTSGVPVTLPSLPLYNEQGKANLDKVAVCAAITGKTINIPDAYINTEFEFSGTQEFDRRTGYRSKSFLTVPMKDHHDEVIGVLQLINAWEPLTRTITMFGQAEQELVESLASQAAVALSNQRLIEQQQRLFEAFIELIAKAIDDKSPYTGGHCRRVPELTMMLADAAARINIGPLKDFAMTEEEHYALKVAGWLHDCGKIVTPEHVIDKATKLETIFDRIHLINTRFEVLKRDTEIAMLRKRLAVLEQGDKEEGNTLEAEFAKEVDILTEERNFLHHCNIGTEFMSEENKQRVRQIAKRRWSGPGGRETNFLTENEVYNLIINKGTLTPEEREVINYHAVATINLLESLPYPSSLKQVPEYASRHHERMDGKGYPLGLTREQMSIPARIMGIADIFEALTARDRPYKTPMRLSEALTVLGRMKEDHHIDPDLFDVFIHERVYLQYASKFLYPDQIDAVDVTTLPGYNPIIDSG